MLVISRFTTPVKSTDMKEKLFYKWEDAFLWPASVASFTFKATFSYIDDEGNKKSYTGSRDGKEV